MRIPKKVIFTNLYFFLLLLSLTALFQIYNGFFIEEAAYLDLHYGKRNLDAFTQNEQSSRPSSTSNNFFFDGKPAGTQKHQQKPHQPHQPQQSPQQVSNNQARRIGTIGSDKEELKTNKQTGNGSKVPSKLGEQSPKAIQTAAASN